MTEVNSWQDIIRRSGFIHDAAKSDFAYFGLAVGGQYNATNPTLTDKDWTTLQLDASGRLKCILDGATISLGGDLNVDVSAFKNEAGTQKDAKVNAGDILVIQTGSGTDATAMTNEIATETTLGDIKTNIATPTTLTGGTKTVTTAGVAESLGASTTIKSVYIRATSTNTGNIYVGGSGVSSANGIALAANDSVEINIANLATVYIDSDVNGEGAGFTYFE